MASTPIPIACLNHKLSQGWLGMVYQNTAVLPRMISSIKDGVVEWMFRAIKSLSWHLPLIYIKSHRPSLRGSAVTCIVLMLVQEKAQDSSVQAVTLRTPAILRLKN